MKAIGAAVAQEINRRSPSGSLRLAGYSFGGCAAFEAAQHLINGGRSVRFLGIIDAPLVSGLGSREHNTQKTFWCKWSARLRRKINAVRSEGLSLVGRVAARELLGKYCSSDLRRRRVLSMMKRVQPCREIFLRRLLLKYFRLKAIKDWRPVYLRGAVFLAISQDHAHSIDRWKCLCPYGLIVRLPGRHLQVFEPRSLEVLMPAFEEAAHNAVFGEPLTN